MADVVAAQNVMSRSRRLIRADRVIRYRVEKDRELRCTVARAAYASQLLMTPQFAERAAAQSSNAGTSPSVLRLLLIQADGLGRADDVSRHGLLDVRT